MTIASEGPEVAQEIVDTKNVVASALERMRRSACTLKEFTAQDEELQRALKRARDLLERVGRS